MRQPGIYLTPTGTGTEGDQQLLFGLLVYLLSALFGCFCSLVDTLLGAFRDAFARIDPSNPAPLFLEAAIRMTDMTFLDIMNEFTAASTALTELKKMAGKN